MICHPCSRFQTHDCSSEYSTRSEQSLCEIATMKSFGASNYAVKSYWQHISPREQGPANSLITMAPHRLAEVVLYYSVDQEHSVKVLPHSCATAAFEH